MCYYVPMFLCGSKNFQVVDGFEQKELFLTSFWKVTLHNDIEANCIEGHLSFVDVF